MNARLDLLNTSSSVAIAAPYGCCPKSAPGVDTPPELIVTLVTIAERAGAAFVRSLPDVNRALGMLRQ